MSKHDITLTGKILLLTWFVAIGMIWGFMEAYLFQFIQENDWQNYYEPYYHGLMLIFAILIILLVPILTNERTDWLFVLGGGFLLQFLEDIGHWISRIFILRNHPIDGGFWTPLWDILGIDFPIPLFWIIDVIVATFFIGIWLLLEETENIRYTIKKLWSIVFN